jgi:hypothetical protein
MIELPDIVTRFQAGCYCSPLQEGLHGVLRQKYRATVSNGSTRDYCSIIFGLLLAIRNALF